MHIDKEELLARICELVASKHDKMDSAGTLTQGSRDKSEGYIEALYQIENLIINWGGR